MYQQPYPGPTPSYGGNLYAIPPPQQPAYDYKSPYENDRFKPRTTVNDPIFLILFVLQVSCEFSLLFLNSPASTEA
jgi:hypothetical protein